MTDVSGFRKRIAVSIEFQTYLGDWPPPDNAVNPTVWFGSHNDIIYPTGVTPLSARLHQGDGVSSFRWEAQFYSGKYQISNLTLKVVDKDGSLSNEIATKLVDEIGSRRAIVRLFEVDAGEQVIDVGRFNDPITSFGSQVICTYLMMDHSFDTGLITIECEDIVRTLVDTVFEQKDLVQASDISENDGRISVCSSDGEVDTLDGCEFAHNEKYTFNPGPHSHDDAVGRVGYKRIANTGEIFSHSPMDVVNSRFDTLQRGIFGTSRAASPYDTDLEDKRNGPKIENIIYLEEQATTMLYMLLTGQTSQSAVYSRNLPRSYHVDMWPMWVNEYSFFGDHSANGTADNLRLRILRDRPISNFKTWMEDHILGPMRSVLHINRFGQLELVKLQATKKGSEQVVLDMSNITEFSELRHVKKQIKNPVVVEYDKSILDGEFKRTYGYNDGRSIKINQRTEEHRVQYETLYSGVVTSAQVDKIRIGLQDFHSHEHLTMSVGVLPSLRKTRLQIGHRVRVKIPKMRDDAQTEPFDGDLEIDRVFMIQGVEYNPMTCETRLQLIATLDRATEQARTENLSEIPDEKYPVDKINVFDVPALANGITTDNTGGITSHVFTGNITIDAGRYWVPDTLFINGTINVTGDFELWVRGELWINGKVDTSEQGIHKPGTITANDLTRIAEGGYFGSPIPVGNTRITINASGSFDYRTSLVDPVDAPTGEVEELPIFNLSNECGCLRGIPPSLAGTPSSATTDAEYVTALDGTFVKSEQGVDGARGGASQTYVSRGGGFGAGSKLCTNGEDGAEIVIDGDSNGASGDNIFIKNSSGMPGGLAWITDGGFHPPPFSDQTIEQHFDAFAGNPQASRQRLGPRGRSKQIGAGGVNQYWPVTDGSVNRAIAASRHQYVPENQKLRDSQNTHWLDSEADLNPDGTVRAWSYLKDGDAFANLDPTTGLPPVPNPGSRDLWFSRSAIDSNLPASQVQVWRWENGEWDVISGYDSTAALMLQLCRTENIGTIRFSQTRPSDCRPGMLWVDNVNTDKAVQCGDTPADDRLVWLRSYGEQGDDLVEDGRFLIHAECEPTWQSDTNRNGGPQIFPGAFPKYPEQIVGSTLFGKTIGENGTPGWQIDATGTGSYRVVRPRRQVRIHPGMKYVIESIISTAGLVVGNPAAEGYTVFATYWDSNGNKLGDNGTDTALGVEHFHSQDTSALTPSGWFAVHHAVTIPETLTDARYMTINCMVHAVSGNVLLSDVHCRRDYEVFGRINFGDQSGLWQANQGGGGFFQRIAGTPIFNNPSIDIPAGARVRISFKTRYSNTSIDTNQRIFLAVNMGNNGATHTQKLYSRQMIGVHDQFSVTFDTEFIAEEFVDFYNFFVNLDGIPFVGGTYSFIETEFFIGGSEAITTGAVVS